jgi:large-conductance mechanosensitive channel
MGATSSVHMFQSIKKQIINVELNNKIIMSPPSWWLIHLGEILAAVVMFTLVGMLGFIIYIDNLDKKEEEERAAKAKAKKENEKAKKAQVVQPKVGADGKPILTNRKGKSRREKSTSPERK